MTECAIPNCQRHNPATSCRKAALDAILGSSWLTVVKSDRCPRINYLTGEQCNDRPGHPEMHLWKLPIPGVTPLKPTGIEVFEHVADAQARSKAYQPQREAIEAARKTKLATEAG